MSRPDAGEQEEVAAERPERFSLLVGGPFNELLGRCGLLDADGLPTPLAALGLSLVAWLLPGLAALLQSALDPVYRGAVYFTDVSTITRFFVAVGVMVLTERHADERLAQLGREFEDSGVIGSAARAPFLRYLRDADRQTSSRLAQLVMLALALLSAGQSMDLTLAVERMGWEGRLAGEAAVLSWPGMAARWFSIPLFQFLILLWLWRLAVWSLLLLRISRLPLHLVPLHPDRVAGLGFLNVFPGIFRGFVFALSCVVAALMFKDLQSVQGHEIEFLRRVAVIWVGFIVLVLVAPLCVFYPPLYALRERELSTNAQLVNRHFRAFHRRWISGEEPGSAVADDHAERPSLGDLSIAIAAVQDMRTVPVDRAALIQIAIAALVPLVVVGATQIPISELLGRIVGIVV